MQTKVVGLDLSLTATGVAVLTFEDDIIADAELATVRSSATGQGVELYSRLTRLESLSAAITDYCEHVSVDLVAIEGPSYGSKGGSSWDRAGLWWLVVRKISAPIVVIPPGTLKKWATNNGQASKAAVKDAIDKYWDTSIDIRNHNEADALCLATIGSQLMGLTLPESQWPHGSGPESSKPKRNWQKAALDKVQMPKGLMP